MSELDFLLQKARERGIKIEFVDSDKLHDFAAMNWMTAKKFGIEDFPENTIWIDKEYQIPSRTLETTEAENLKHELDEASKEQHGEKYWQAHIESLAEEKKTTVQIPKARIVKVHDDGDLTVKYGNMNYVVTTAGQAFRETKNKTLKRRLPKAHKPTYHETYLGAGIYEGRKHGKRRRHVKI